MEKTIDQGTWVVERSVQLSALTIAEGAGIAAPAGKYLTLTVDGVGTAPAPGVYRGDVRITVCDEFIRTSLRFGEKTVSSFHAGAIVSDGRLVRESSVPAVIAGGSVTDSEASDISIESHEWDFNGFYITGKSTYAIRNMKMHLVGDGTDDFVGMGAGVATAGNARVTISDSEILTEGIGRGTLFVGGNSEVTVNGCTLSTVSCPPTPEEMAEGARQQRMMEPPWSIGLKGNGRTLNVAGHGILNINHSRVSSNSWGACSIDGAIVNRMNITDSVVEITGSNGYGCFCICDDFLFDYKSLGAPGCIDTVVRSVFNVPYTGILMSLGNGMGVFRDGSVVNSGRFGAFVHRNSGGRLKVNSGAAFKTKSSCVVVKGSNTFFEFDNAVLEPGNGTILQLMDNDDVGMCMDPFLVPVGETDVRDGRDLTVAVPTEDVFVSFSHMETSGNLFNSTTNLMACNRRLPAPPDAPPAPPAPSIPMGPDGKPVLRGFVGEDLMGAKNLDVKLVSAKLTGMVSAASQAYGEGITRIDHDHCDELSNITQTPAAPVNNGVILSVDRDSVWTVTGTSYLTKLTVEGRVESPDGSPVSMTVDGKKTELLPGVYTGLIVVTPGQ